MSLGSALSDVIGGQNTYNAQSPYGGQAYSNISDETQSNFNTNYTNEGTLAAALAAQAAGQGPNPALTQLNQTTQANNAAAAGMAASNRGLNAGLAARIAGQAAANNNQTAAGQAATMSAEQQLGAESNLAGLENNMATQNENNQQTTNQGQLGAEQINAGISQNNANQAASAGGGLINGLASGIASFLAKGGRVAPVPRYADGGTVVMPNFQLPTTPVKPMNFGGVSSLISSLGGSSGKGFANAENGIMSNSDASMDQTGANIMTSDTPVALPSLGVGGAPATLAAPSLGVDTSTLAASPGLAAALFKQGGQVPGRAKVKGDSYKNDTVPAMVSPGEIVLPRHVTEGKNAPEAAKKFVQALIDKENEKKQKFARGGRVTPGQGLSAILQAQASLHSRLKKIEGKKAS